MPPMKTELSKRLDQMIGRAFMYHARQFSIQDIVVEHGNVVFLTSSGRIVINKSDLEHKIDDFLEVEKQEEIHSYPAEIESELSTTIQTAEEKMDKLESIILKNIEKIQADRSYLPQANQITKDINTILKMNQQKIDLFRELRKTKQGIKH